SVPLGVSLLAEEEARSCGVVSLRWLVRHAGVERAVCAVADSESGHLLGLAGIGVTASAGGALPPCHRGRHPPPPGPPPPPTRGACTRPSASPWAAGETFAFHATGQPLLRAVETPLGNL